MTRSSSSWPLLEESTRAPEPTRDPVKNHNPRSVSFARLNKYIDKRESTVLARPASAPPTATYETDRFTLEPGSFYALPKNRAQASAFEVNRYKERDENKLMRRDILTQERASGWSHAYNYPPRHVAKNPMFQTKNLPQMRPGTAVNKRMQNTHGRLFDGKGKPRT
jgi:hypothetical protein